MGTLATNEISRIDHNNLQLRFPTLVWISFCYAVSAEDPIKLEKEGLQKNIPSASCGIKFHTTLIKGKHAVVWNGS